MKFMGQTKEQLTNVIIAFEIPTLSFQSCMCEVCRISSHICFACNVWWPCLFEAVAILHAAHPNTHPTYKPLILILRGRRNSHPSHKVSPLQTDSIQTGFVWAIWSRHASDYAQDWILDTKPASLMFCEIADKSDFGRPIN